MSSELTTILAAFEAQGLSGNDLVSKQTLLNVLTRMNGQQQFDNDVFDELWEQCNPYQKLEVREFADAIYRARHILSNRIADSNRSLTTLKQTYETLDRQYQQSRDYATKQDLQTRINSITNQVKDIQEDIQQSAFDLDLLNKPFFRPNSFKQSAFRSPFASPEKPELNLNPYLLSILVPEQALCSELPIKAKAEQRILFLFVVIAIVAELIIMDTKIGFLSLLSYTLILYFAVYPTVPKHYWLVNVALIGFSILLDILWLAFYAPVWWWSKSDSSNSLGFQRFHIILASILLLVKCFTTVLLFIGFKPTNTQLSSEMRRSSSRII